MKVKDLIEHLQGYDLEAEVAYELWCVDDVKWRCEDMEYGDITNEQCNDVLAGLNDVGADIGQNWDTMDCFIQNVLEGVS